MRKKPHRLDRAAVMDDWPLYEWHESGLCLVARSEDCKAIIGLSGEDLYYCIASVTGWKTFEGSEHVEETSLERLKIHAINRLRKVQKDLDTGEESHIRIDGLCSDVGRIMMPHPRETSSPHRVFVMRKL